MAGGDAACDFGPAVRRGCSRCPAAWHRRGLPMLGHQCSFMASMVNGTASGCRRRRCREAWGKLRRRTCREIRQGDDANRGPAWSGWRRSNREGSVRRGRGSAARRWQSSCSPVVSCGAVSGLRGAGSDFLRVRPRTLASRRRNGQVGRPRLGARRGDLGRRGCIEPAPATTRAHGRDRDASLQSRTPGPSGA